MKKILVNLLLIFCFLIGFAKPAEDSIQPKATLIVNQQKLTVDQDSIENGHFNNGFQDKYKNSTFDYETKKHQINAWERFLEWLSGLLSRFFSFSDKQASLNIVVTILKTLAILIILFVIYLIAKSILNKEGQWIFGKNSDRKIINYTEIEKNLQLVDFEKLIKNTLKLNEKRLAIRYYYLWLLKKMSEKEIIAWDTEKTNSDYLNEIKNPTLKENFAYLSYLYNYIWYGEFELDEVSFDQAISTFDKTIQSI
jgi:hypothetical protein